GLAVGVVEGGDDEILQHLDVVFRDHLGIDLQLLHLLRAVDDDSDHAAAGVALDAQIGHLLLQALLHLLRLLHHLLNVHISSTSRISAGKISSIVWTPASASACWRSADFLSAAVRSSAAGGAPASDAAPSTQAAAMRRPATCWAIDSSQP